VRAVTAAPARGPAMVAAGPTAPSSPGGAAEPTQLEQLQRLGSAALREECRRLYRSEPPRLSRDLLIRAIAYRLQELEFGGLPKWARQTLAGSAVAPEPSDESAAATPKSTEPLLKPGVRLVREWHGRTHTVVVLDDAFEFEGRHYF
jgi:hypothetical protein